jgi:hypothetical protein
MPHRRHSPSPRLRCLRCIGLKSNRQSRAVANIQPDGDLCAVRKAEEEVAGAFVEEVVKRTRMLGVIWQPKLFREQIRFGGPYK